MTTLYYEEEIRLDESELKNNYTEKEMDLALKLIDSMTSKFNPSEYKDEYQDKIKDAIEQKVAGKEIKRTKKKKEKTITNLLEALESSLKNA